MQIPPCHSANKPQIFKGKPWAKAELNFGPRACWASVLPLGQDGSHDIINYTSLSSRAWRDDTDGNEPIKLPWLWSPGPSNKSAQTSPFKSSSLQVKTAAQPSPTPTPLRNYRQGVPQWRKTVHGLKLWLIRWSECGTGTIWSAIRVDTCAAHWPYPVMSHWPVTGPEFFPDSGQSRPVQVTLTVLLTFLFNLSSQNAKLVPRLR